MTLRGSRYPPPPSRQPLLSSGSQSQARPLNLPKRRYTNRGEQSSANELDLVLSRECTLAHSPVRSFINESLQCANHGEAAEASLLRDWTLLLGRSLAFCRRFQERGNARVQGASARLRELKGDVEEGGRGGVPKGKRSWWLGRFDEFLRV
ncbi:hypothetical protein KM043_008279 [Ampulex compressa]|nr:hypothetical protein KM043_008279 [Ampulex compressa]